MQTLEKGWIFRIVLCVLTLCLVAGAAETEQKLLGDESDGSRAHPIHRIELLAEPSEAGEEAVKVDPNIDPEEEVLLPFSTKQTCGTCHSYGIIAGGWHFNAVDPNVEHGRPGQPWLYVDARTGTQIPLSYRSWPGTYKPAQFGLSDREFTKIFGRQMPGGGPGETDDLDEVMRQYVSGKLEINCLSCHNGDPRQDQGGPAGYAVQVSRGNFRWATAASSGLATVTGSANDMDEMYDPFDPFSVESAQSGKKKPPTIAYHKNVFDYENTVFFDILREVPAHRCYFCHSNLYIGKEHTEKWACDEDIHMKAGMTCVDCHRNGIAHNINRGYPGEEKTSGNKLTATSSCEGCHLGDKSTSDPDGGRLGAPVPEHRGLLAVHFKRLTCTACHSGPWPAAEPHATKTSIAHRLGTPNVNKAREMLPHIASPVFAAREDGKIAPHKLVWPAFWGVLKGEQVEPIEFNTVTKVIGGLFEKEELPFSGDWPDLTSDHIVKGLTSLKSAGSLEGKAVYISGGKLYSLDDSGQLSEQADHPAAKPYIWPIGHEVRPAAQSLGIRYCTDCHGTDAPFFFGDVAVDTPVVADRQAKRMVDFQDVDPFYAWAFAFSFVFRTMMKMVVLGSIAVLSLVLLSYVLKALTCVVKVLGGEND
ncbi:hypothetical protein ACFL5Z_11450 [Planctomycetota bacterium]